MNTNVRLLLGPSSIGIVIVHPPKNKIEFYRMFADELVAAIAAARPGRVVHVP
jgi:hypothetical protein